VATGDAGDPRVVRAALDAQPDEPGRRVCDQDDLPDTGRVQGTDVAEIAAATEMLVERITCACALDATAFLPAAALRALEASITPPPPPRSVPGRL
jgi:hypothetical protein